jgi:hypothetical protein
MAPVAAVSVVFAQLGVAAVPVTKIPPMVVMLVDAQVSGEMVVFDPLQFPAPESVTVGVEQPLLFHAQLHALQSRVSVAVSTTALHDDVKPGGHDETHVGGTLPE